MEFPQTAGPVALPGSRLMSVHEGTLARLLSAAGVLPPAEAAGLLLNRRGAATRLVNYALDHLIRAYTQRPTEREGILSAGLPAPDGSGCEATIKGGDFPDGYREV